MSPLDISQPSPQLREVPQPYFEIIAKSGFIHQPETTFSEGLMRYAFRNGEITPRGRVLEALFRDKTLIDLGCGCPDFSKVPRMLARAFDARGYVGVDQILRSFRLTEPLDLSEVAHPLIEKKYVIPHHMNPIFSRIENELPTSWYCDSMLGFLSKIPQLHHGTVFMFCGIDADLYGEMYGQYAIAVAHEISRLSHIGDGVVIRDAFDGKLHQALEKSGRWKYMTDDRSNWDTIVMRLS